LLWFLYHYEVLLRTFSPSGVLHKNKSQGIKSRLSGGQSCPQLCRSGWLCNMRWGRELVFRKSNTKLAVCGRAPSCITNRVSVGSRFAISWGTKSLWIICKYR
jgi:hypothetical protein